MMLAGLDVWSPDDKPVTSTRVSNAASLIPLHLQNEIAKGSGRSDCSAVATNPVYASARSDRHVRRSSMYAVGRVSTESARATHVASSLTTGAGSTARRVRAALCISASPSRAPGPFVSCSQHGMHRHL